MKLSEKIRLVVMLLEDLGKDHSWHCDLLKDAEGEVTNIYHELIGIGTPDGAIPTSKERSKLATRLQKALMRRRAAKDVLDLLAPICEFVKEKPFVEVLNTLKQLQGHVRHREESMAARTYCKRTEFARDEDPQREGELNGLMRQWGKQKVG